MVCQEHFLNFLGCLTPIPFSLSPAVGDLKSSSSSSSYPTSLLEVSSEVPIITDESKPQVGPSGEEVDENVVGIVSSGQDSVQSLM